MNDSRRHLISVFGELGRRLRGAELGEEPGGRQTGAEFESVASEAAGMSGRLTGADFEGAASEAGELGGRLRGEEFEGGDREAAVSGERRTGAEMEPDGRLTGAEVSGRRTGAEFESVASEAAAQLEESGRGLTEPDFKAVAHQAVTQNPWFTLPEIMRAADAICDTMLDEAKLAQWLAPYPPAREPRNVGVIMAGNIPMVGFFDMLCVLASGHRCFYKPSSKDSVLINYVARAIKSIDPKMPLCLLDDQDLDAVIATGSDNARRHFKSRYGGIPSIIRGNRASVAILDEGETSAQLAGLCSDIFSYSGLGCRNISHLFVPQGYDFGALVDLAASVTVNPKFVNNYRQRRAILKMQGRAFTDGGFFVLTPGEDFPAYISEITYQRYASLEQVKSWIAANDHQIQCVETTAIDHPRRVDFGQAQSPSLTDYPDSVDVLDFLAKL